MWAREPWGGMYQERLSRDCSVDLWGHTEMGMKAFTEVHGVKVGVEVKVTGLGNQTKQDSIPRPLTS